MTETAEREIEVVSGVIEGVTRKKPASDDSPGTWQVAIKPDGSQYTKNLWTKDAELVAALDAKLGQSGAFVCSASYWTRQDGQQVRSLWINHAGDAAALEAASESFQTRSTHAAAPQARATSPAGDGMTKEEWARKDSAIHKMACIKTAADALKHTLPSSVGDPNGDPEARIQNLNRFNANVIDLADRWHRSVLAERDDPTGEDVPF